MKLKKSNFSNKEERNEILKNTKRSEKTGNNIK